MDKCKHLPFAIFSGVAEVRRVAMDEVALVAKFTAVFAASIPVTARVFLFKALTSLFFCLVLCVVSVVRNFTTTPFGHVAFSSVAGRDWQRATKKKTRHRHGRSEKNAEC